MIKFNRFLFSLLLTGLAAGYTPSSQAEDNAMAYGGRAYGNAPFHQAEYDSKPMTYGEKVQAKALSASTNLSSSVLEIPKNIINTTNDSNIFYGLVGGTIKGVLNVCGRVGVAVADLVTLPLPTKPIASPDPIWDDFDVDTSYGPVYRLDESEPVSPPAEPIPVAQTAPPPVVTQPEPVDRSQLYNEQTNQALDRVFKKEMMK